jgi:hypothetical protein
MQYVFTMTSRMVTIAVASAILLCVLLFLLGVEIGARMIHAPAAATPQVAVPAASANASSAVSGTVSVASPGADSDSDSGSQPALPDSASSNR